jgi:membrane associated rhomboid family serine protease
MVRSHHTEGDVRWRFIVPMFMHGGLTHIVFNLLFQMTTGFDLERTFGWWRVALIYLISGTFGFIFGASFSSFRVRTSA